MHNVNAGLSSQPDDNPTGLQSQVLPPQLRVHPLFLIFLCHSSDTSLPAERAILLFSCSPSPSAITGISLQHRVSLRLFLLVLYCQQTQVLPIANLDFDKLVIVFSHKHPKEWPFLVYSKFHCFLLSLFSIFFYIYSCFIYFTSPTTSNVSHNYVVTNFVMNFLNLFPHIVLHTL